MDHISNSLIEVTLKQQEQSNYLECSKTTLEPEEAKILQAKYSGTQFGKMIWSDVDTWAKALLMKINAITGWVIPEENLEILLDQFRKKLVESYGNCNPEEIEYAFRNYGTLVKDWGKQMNLSLIDEVMIPYLSRRREVSQREEAIALNQSLQIEYKEDMSQEAMKDWFDAKAKEIKAGQLRVEFVPEMLYEWMDANGNITASKEEKFKYLNRAVEYRLGILRQALDDVDSATNRLALSDFVRMKDAGYLEGSEMSIVKTLAKKILLFELILNSPS